MESMVGKNSQMEQKLAETNSRIDAIQKGLKGVDKGAVKEQEKALETVLANAEKKNPLLKNRLRHKKAEPTDSEQVYAAKKPQEMP